MNRFGVFIRVLALVALVCSAVSCAIGPHGPSDEELVGELVRGWYAAIEQEDVGRVTAFYSKNYLDATGLYYDGVTRQVQHLIGVLRELDGKLGIDNADIGIEGNIAMVGPITIDTSSRHVFFWLVAEKEQDGVWRIISIEG